MGAAPAPVAFDALPAEVEAGTPLDVWWHIAPAHPSHRLEVERRVNGVRKPSVHAWPDGLPSDPGSQRFRALLPPCEAGDVVAYAPVLSRAGLVVAELPVRQVSAVAPPVAAGDIASQPALATGVAPRYDWGTDFLGAFTVQLAKPPESFGPAPDGLHITFYIASGEIHGPRINARIRGEGGDWMLVRRDGVGVADVRITYETDDGALLLSRYYGIFDLGPDGYERALRNDYDPLPPLVLAPQFVTSHPKWLWLNRLQCIAVGRVTMADLLVRFDLYAIRVGQPLPSSGLPRAPDGASWLQTGYREQQQRS